MQKLKPYLKYLRNFYLIVGVTALIWMAFFDRYNILGRIQTQSDIKQLEQDLSFYRSEKAILEDTRVVLENDADELERFARERYRMKRADEDLYILLDKK